MNVGPKVRSGSACPHPRALCHTLWEALLPSLLLYVLGARLGGFCWGELSGKRIGCQLTEGTFRILHRWEVVGGPELLGIMEKWVINGLVTKRALGCLIGKDPAPWSLSASCW